jgi:hypothetical protein
MLSIALAQGGLLRSRSAACASAIDTVFKHLMLGCEMVTQQFFTQQLEWFLCFWGFIFALMSLLFLAVT